MIDEEWMQKMANCGRLVCLLSATFLGASLGPLSALAACEVETTTVKLETVTRGAYLENVFGSIESGVPQVGSTGPIEIQLRNCSASQPTNAHVTNPFVRLDGNNYVPYLIAVNGIELTVPIYLYRGSGYNFIGNPRLSILLVPDRGSIAKNAGTFSDSLVFVFVD